MVARAPDAGKVEARVVPENNGERLLEQRAVVGVGPRGHAVRVGRVAELDSFLRRLERRVGPLERGRRVVAVGPLVGASRNISPAGPARPCRATAATRRPVWGRASSSRPSGSSVRSRGPCALSRDLCGNQNFTALNHSSSTPSTRRLLDGVAMPVPRRSTEPARHRPTPRHTG